jgi:hypothetical protein
VNYAPGDQSRPIHPTKQISGSDLKHSKHSPSHLTRSVNGIFIHVIDSRNIVHRGQEARVIVTEIFGLCAGAFLARHFRALILVPASLTAVASIAIAALITTQGPPQTFLEALSAALAIQIGYFCSVLVKHSVPDPDEANLKVVWPTRVTNPDQSQPGG